MLRCQMLFNRFSHRAYAIHIRSSADGRSQSNLRVYRGEFDCEFNFAEHLSHTEYVSNDRITITIYNICSIFISMQSFIIVVVFMRCVIYLSTVFFLFSLPSIHSYLQAETRPAIMPSPIMPFSGLQKRKI